MKSEKEKWSQDEMLQTFADTPHERHSIMVGFAAGLSEGSKYSCSKKYCDEDHYYAFGWSIGEIVDRITNKNPDDTKQAIAQFLGIVTKYIMVGGVSYGIIELIFG